MTPVESYVHVADTLRAPVKNIYVTLIIIAEGPKPPTLGAELGYFSLTISRSPLS